MHLPSTKITAKSRLYVRRILPISGDVFVQPGQPVNALTVIAQAEKPGGYHAINIAKQLNLPDVDLDDILQVDVDDYVEINKIVASCKKGLTNQTVKSPVAGYVNAVGPGWILLETNPENIEIQAFINGVVTRIIPNQGAIIEADGAVIEATCGFGGEAYGRLKRVVSSPYETIEEAAIDENVSESIVLGGRTINEEALRKAEDWQVRGIIVGSIPSSLMSIDPPVKVRVVATEGFGNMPMSSYTFGVLTALSRREISIRGKTSSPSKKFGTLLPNDPPIIMAADPLPARGSYVGLPAAPKKKLIEAKQGSKVRIIQGELLGSSGTIDLIPPEPQATKAGIIVPGAYVNINNDVHFVPWANLKLIA